MALNNNDDKKTKDYVRVANEGDFFHGLNVDLALVRTFLLSERRGTVRYLHCNQRRLPISFPSPLPHSQITHARVTAKVRDNQRKPLAF